MVVSPSIEMKIAEMTYDELATYIREELNKLSDVLNMQKTPSMAQIKKLESYGGRFIEGYGLVETSPIISVNSFIRRTGTVGFPVPGVRVKVMTDGGKKLGRGKLAANGIAFRVYMGTDKKIIVLSQGPDNITHFLHSVFPLPFLFY